MVPISTCTEWGAALIGEAVHYLPGFRPSRNSAVFYFLGIPGAAFKAGAIASLVSVECRREENSSFSTFMACSTSSREDAVSGRLHACSALRVFQSTSELSRSPVSSNCESGTTRVTRPSFAARFVSKRKPR